MQGSFTRFFPAGSLNFLGFLKSFPACIHATCKKFMQARLGSTCLWIVSLDKLETDKSVSDVCPELNLILVLELR